MNTHTFQLPSGLECEVKELYGEISTYFSKKNLEAGKALDLFLQNVIVRIGKQTEISPALVANMLSADRNKVMFEARQFSFDFPETYHFKYKKREIEIVFEEVIEQKPYSFASAAFSSYEEVLEAARIEVFLPKTQQKVFAYLLDGKAEKKMAKVDVEEASQLTLINLRRPTHISEKSNTEVSIDLTKLPMKDVASLYSAIEQAEGKFDLLYYPENEFLPINLLGYKDFFSPSRI